MPRKPLENYYDNILESCCEDVEIGGFDREGYDYSTNYIGFEEDGYLIEGSFGLAADMIEDGDGYWTPRETIIRNASANIHKLEVTWFDPDTDEEEEVPEAEVQALWAFLDKSIPQRIEW